MVLVFRVIIVTSLALFSNSLFADNASIKLTVKPDRCITLYQGQACYQTLSFNWATPETGEYCLFNQEVSEPLFCWQGNQKQAQKYEFESEQSITYAIFTRDKKQKMAEVKVKVANVYKSKRKNSRNWRLF